MRTGNKGALEAISPYLIFGIYLLVIAAIYILTLRPGIGWGDDFAMYIALAKNIASGHVYVQTGYIPNPYNPNLSPTAYPPVFPLILAPIYMMFGLDIHAMKITLVVVFLAMLTLCYVYARRRLDNKILTYLYMGAMGLSPWLWRMRGGIVSDIPFMFFVFLSLLLAEVALVTMEETGDTWVRMLLAFVAGVATYLAYGAREVGGLLIPVFILFDILRHRRISGASIVITATFAALALVQRHFVHSEAGYAEILTMYHWSVFPDHAMAYARLIVGYWGDDGLGKVGGVLVFLIVAPLYVIGWVWGFSQRKSIYSIFVPAYMCVLIVVPIIGGNRYLLPILPFLLLDIFLGIKVVGYRFGIAKERAIATVVVVAVVASYAFWYKNQHLGPIADGPYSEQSRQLFSFIRKQTRPDSVFIFRKPRALALFTDRRAAAPPLPGQYSTLWPYIQSIGADYVIVKYAGLQFDKQPYLENWAKENQQRLDLVFSNDWFQVYRIKGAHLGQT